MVNEIAAAGVQQNSAAYPTQEAGGTLGASFQEEVESRMGGTGIKESMDDIFAEAAERFGLSVKLLKAVAKRESNFNPNAVSRAGAQGVMQLMPGTARSLGVTNAFDARQNIMGGAQYLKTNLDRYGGNVALALAAYNAGPGNVDKYGGVPPFAETQNYVSSILSKLDGEEAVAGRYVVTGLPGMETNSLSAQWANLLKLNSLSGMGNAGSLPDAADSMDSGISSGLLGMGAFGGSSGTMSLLPLLLGMSGLSSSGEGFSQEDLSNLLQILRIQMMMKTDNTMGDSVI